MPLRKSKITEYDKHFFAKFSDIEEKARLSKLGLWGLGDFPTPPWDFRREAKTK